MKWTIAKARARFSELLRKSANEPQPIFSRDKLVAAVIGAESFEEFSAWISRRKRRSVGDAFGDLRKILAEEGYTFEVPDREDRRNEFAETMNELPR